MRVIVTGGAGFIGSRLALSLRESYQVRILDNFSSGSATLLSGFRGRVIEGDILEIEDLCRDWTPDLVFHQAAITDTTILDSEVMFRVNVEGFRQVLEFARACGSKVIYASSAAVYGDGSVPMTENQAPRPLNAYGQSKLEMERMAREYAERHGMEITGLRYFNVYGPGEQYKGKVASMVWQLAQQMITGRRPRIFKWGEQERDQVYVKDVVQANLLAMSTPGSGVYNVGTGHSVSFNEVVRVLNKVLGMTFEPDYFDNPYGFYQNSTRADIARAREVLGFEPHYDLLAGVQDYFRSSSLAHHHPS